MSNDVELQFDAEAYLKDADRVVRAYLAAGTRAVAKTTKGLERSLEAATQQAVPGRLWRAWTSSVFPRSGPAKEPVGTVFLNGGSRTRGAMAFWTQQGEIRGKSGQYLAVPLPTAGSRGRAHDITPGEWERANGQKLVFIYRQGKPSILAAIGGTTNGRSGTYRPLTRGRVSKGRGGTNPQADAVVPIFVLLPMVRFRGSLAIDPLIQRAIGELPGAFEAEVRGLTD
jgi:hypothetical protein